MDNENETTNKTPLTVSAIIAVLIVVAAAWYQYNKNMGDDQVVPEPPPPEATSIPDVDATDHVFGNPQAPITFIVYSDFLCPFCKDYHNTMRRIVEEYGKDGKVALVFRHMPIAKLHPESPTYALASECVAQSAGNKGFWDFAELLFATVTPEYELDSKVLTSIATEAGATPEDFSACMRSSNLMSRVEQDFNDAIDAGAVATPYTVLVTPHQKLPRAGARSYLIVAGTVETMLRNLVEEEGLDEDGRMRNLFDDTSDTGQNANNSTPVGG